MAYNRISPLGDVQFSVVNPSAGSSSGSKTWITAPFRGQLLEAGFIPQSVITSNTTLAVSVSKFVDSTTSLFTEVITSTLGAFQSINLIEGFVASVVPASPTYVNAGDTLRLTTSGGQTSLVAATVYSIFRRA